MSVMKYKVLLFNDGWGQEETTVSNHLFLQDAIDAVKALKDKAELSIQVHEAAINKHRDYCASLTIRRISRC